jgi:drug/metabolite transporter (DMT)-like permease
VRDDDHTPAKPAAAPAPAHTVPRWVSIGILLVMATIFASNHIAARIAFDHGVSVGTAVAVRSTATAAVVAALIALTGGRFALPAPTLRRAGIVGLLLSVQSYCLYSAVARIPVALALLAFNAFPFMLALLSWAMGGERPRRRTLVAMSVALVGLALALDVVGRVGGSGDLGADAGRRWAQIGPGVGFALGGAMAFATSLYLMTRWLGQVDGRLRTVLTMVVVAVVATLAGAATGSLAWPHDAPGWIGLALLSVLYGTAITGVFVVLPRIGAVNNSPALNFEPIASLVLGWLILGQSVAPVQVLGALVVIGAIVWLSVGGR